MIKPIVIKVVDKVPTLISGPRTIVCNNTEPYIVEWMLDEEWDQYESRTMQINLSDDTHIKKLFVGDRVELPAIPVPGYIHIGLFAGDMITTKPIRYYAEKATNTPCTRERSETPNGYAQVIVKLDQKLDKNLGADNAGKVLVIDKDGNVVPGTVQGGGSALFSKIGSGLKVEDGTLMVDTTNKMEQDNTKPITSAAVYAEVGNINALLATI